MPILFKNGPVTVYLPDRFPIRIDPIGDESLSSWIIRVATFYHLRPSDLIRACNAAPSLGLHNLDEKIPGSALESLSRLTDVAPHTIEALAQHRRYPALDKRWLRYLTDELAHCESCLGEMHDRHGFAYLKADWQLRCVTTCHIHRIPLISVCRYCLNFVSLEYLENRNRWEVICRRCALKHVRQSVETVSHPVALHFIIELEQLLLDSLRANESYLYPFNGGDARSLMCAILDMLELNEAKLNVLANTDPPIKLSWFQGFSTELLYDCACLLDVLQMTADEKTLQYICGDLPPSMFTAYYCEASTRLMRVQARELSDFLARRQRWPSALQRLAERTWIAVAETRAQARRRTRTLHVEVEEEPSLKDPDQNTTTDRLFPEIKSPSQSCRTQSAEELRPITTVTEQHESRCPSNGGSPNRRYIQREGRRSVNGWRRPGSAELQPYSNMIEQIRLELTAQGRLVRPDDLQKLAFRRMRERRKDE